MRKLLFVLAMIPVAVPLTVGCGRSGENQIIEQDPGAVTPEMIEIEEGELETTQ